VVAFAVEFVGKEDQARKEANPGRKKCAANCET
jgi:hypothetical protein